MRYAIRRTQRELDAERKSSKSLETVSYRELQEMARYRGINARQSAEALRKVLSK